VLHLEAWTEAACQPLAAAPSCAVADLPCAAAEEPSPAWAEAAQERRRTAERQEAVCCHLALQAARLEAACLVDAHPAAVEHLRTAAAGLHSTGEYQRRPCTEGFRLDPRTTATAVATAQAHTAKRAHRHCYATEGGHTHAHAPAGGAWPGGIAPGGGRPCCPGNTTPWGGTPGGGGGYPDIEAPCCERQRRWVCVSSSTILRSLRFMVCHCAVWCRGGRLDHRTALHALCPHPCAVQPSRGARVRDRESAASTERNRDCPVDGGESNWNCEATHLALLNACRLQDEQLLGRALGGGRNAVGHRHFNARQSGRVFVCPVSCVMRCCSSASSASAVFS
jgi:hypothetical protein